MMRERWCFFLIYGHSWRLGIIETIFLPWTAIRGAKVNTKLLQRIRSMIDFHGEMYLLNVFYLIFKQKTECKASPVAVYGAQRLLVYTLLNWHYLGLHSHIHRLILYGIKDFLNKYNFLRHKLNSIHKIRCNFV